MDFNSLSSENYICFECGQTPEFRCNECEAQLYSGKMNEIKGYYGPTRIVFLMWFVAYIFLGFYYKDLYQKGLFLL